MLIDWFTVGAQALNFLILVWLMRRYLYRPILNAIDAREKKIAAELADAAAKKAEAQKDRDEFQKKNADFDQQRAALLGKATDEAKTEGRRLLDEARKGADALNAKWQESLRTEAHNLSQAISRRTQQEVFAIAGKALADLATTGLEERLGEVFTRRLREMDGRAKEAFGVALKTAARPALVRSAFDLPATQRATIQNALNETFAADIRLRYETAPDLVGGIELSANGQKVAWSIADYLTSLEKAVDEVLKKQEHPEPKPAPKVEPKPAAQPAPSPTVEAKAPPESKAKSNPEPAAKTEPSSEPKAEPKTATKVATKPAAEPVPEGKTEAEPNAKPKLGAQAMPSKPEANPPAKPEAAVKAEPSPKPAAESEAKSKPNAQPEAKSPTEPEASPAPKAEAAATPEPAGTAQPKVAPVPVAEPQAAVPVAPEGDAAAKAAPRTEGPKAAATS
jgi:F-type H+-transporting ATPase subunit b